LHCNEGSPSRLPLQIHELPLFVVIPGRRQIGDADLPASPESMTPAVRSIPLPS
jgi:hypothetical protein